ncbi:mCG147166 [Mus musculus]|nr:mCG147166 [Mus musculus]
MVAFLPLLSLLPDCARHSSKRDLLEATEARSASCKEVMATGSV